MAFGRLVAATARAGLATVRRLRSVRWPYLRLTDAGDAKARALAGLAQVDATVELLREILRQQVEHPGPGGWVSEFWLADDGRDMHELRAIEAMALPGLWRGWLEAHSDVHGHARYRVLPGGLAALAAGPHDPDPTAPDQEAADLYDTTLAAALDRLASAAPDDGREIGLIPLPCSMPGGPTPGDLSTASRETAHVP
jgi:hypothetical protein